MTQYKDKSADRSADNVNAGLLYYPILMAADILMYKPTKIPVGQDQTQHVELARDAAKFFNKKFGNTFPEPQPLYTEVPKIMSLLEPDKKMAKSLGDKHCIYLDDEPEVIKNKIRKAVASTKGLYEIGMTDTNSLMHKAEESVINNPEFRGGINLFKLLVIFDEKKANQYLKNDRYNYSEIKDLLADSISNYFTKFRKNKKAIDDQTVLDIFEQGAAKARLLADQTMAEIRKKIGLIE
jgi:tryptophanyl-tRNA synthetase